MEKNKLFFRVIIGIAVMTIFQNVAYAIPTIKSAEDQTFDENQSFVQLRYITITEDSSITFIKKGIIKITIPDSIKIIFDNNHTKSQILLYGTAVTHGKIAEIPEVTFENGDKTLVIPINEDFAPGENVVITRIFVEGFNESPANSTHLILQINDDLTEYIDSKYLYVQTSAIEDYTSPDQPTNISITDNAEGGVKITWTDPTDLDLQKIEILKGKNNDPVSGTIFTEVMKGIQEYIDTDAVEGDTVKYILRASDGRNLSLNTAEFAFVVGSTVIEEPVEEEIPQGVDATAEEEVCTLDYTPVCGVDGITYTNECVANKEPVEIAHEGECEGASEEENTEEPIEETQKEIEVNFTDIEDHWAGSIIENLAKKGIVTGQSKEIFNPEGDLNRAEAAAMLYRILGLEEPVAPEEKPFSDVVLSEWYAGYINELKILELVNGNPDGTYRPENEINRAEFLALAMNIYYYLADENAKVEVDSLKTGDQTKEYIDLKTEWYTSIVTAATLKEFIHGSACGEFKCFNAEEDITRAEATTILYNIFFASLEESVEE